MDISYTNVLEGARQYFQGLPSPALSGSPSQPLVLAPSSGSGVPHAAPDPPPDARYEHVGPGAPQPPVVVVASQAATQLPSNALTYWPPIATASPYQRKELTASPQVRVSTPLSMQHSKIPTSSSFSSAFNGTRGSGDESAQPAQQSAQPPVTAQRPQGHNLPPIAALSNYHSSRSSSAQKSQAQPTSHAAAAASASSKAFQRAALQPEYTLPRQNQAQYVSASASGATRLQYGQQGPKYQQIGVVPTSTPTPTPAVAAASTTYHSFPPATSAASSSTPVSATPSVSAPPLSSQAPPPPQPHYAYHPSPGEQPPKSAPRGAYPAQAPYYPATSPAAPHHSVLVNGHQHPKPPTPVPGARPTPPGGARVKRESPLDLSVKTVRQSADSTADDSEGFGSRSYASPAPQAKGRPSLTMPTAVGGGGYPSMPGASRAPTPRSVVAPTQSVGAPKIDLDFVGNFNVHQQQQQHHQQQQQQQQQQQHAPLMGPHYGQQDALQRPKERPYPPQQQSSSSLAPSGPHLGAFKPISASSAYDGKPAMAAYSHSAINHTAMPYDPKQVQPTSYNHKMPTQPTPIFDNKYAPFPTYNPKSANQPVTSKAPQQPVYEHKQMQPGHYNTAYQKQQAYDHKVQQPFDYNKKVQQPNMDHKQALQSSYDQNKHANVLNKYDQKPVGHVMQTQVQPKTWEHKKQSQIPSYDYKSGPPQLSTLEQHKGHAYQSTQQQRMPSKASPAGQPYSSHQFPAAATTATAPPVSGGYDPTKRAAELPAGYAVNRPSYRPLPTNTAYPNQAAPGHKRPADPCQQAPSNKIPRVNDTWRQTIDQEIEQRFSSYTSSRLQQSVNGNAENTSTGRQEAAYLQRQNHVPAQPGHSGRPNPPQQNYNQHSVVPGNHGTSQYPPHQQQHARGVGASLPRMLAMAPRTGRNRAAPGGGAANKRVLNILRNTLEEKEARMTQLQNQLQHNAQLQQQYQQRQPQTSEAPAQMIHHQKPAVSPTLPPGRHNLPPHGAGLENSHHKLGAARDLSRPGAHLEAAGTTNTQALLTDITRQQQAAPPPPPVADLEGFAAYLAARIRTKGELKQVGPSMEQMNSMHQQHFRCPTPSSSVVSASNSRAHSPRSTPGGATVFSPPPPASGPHDDTTPPSGAGGSPPKLTRERLVVPPPRRRLFSRPEEDPGCPEGAPVGVAPPSLPFRDSSGLRSSSETSVFDFRDSDSEGEMPVLERQTLNEMRKDRRLHPSKQTPCESGGPADGAVNDDDYDKDEDELDPFWSATCESFVEQLRTGSNPEGPKRGRGRRKKADEFKTKPAVPKHEETEVVCDKVDIKQEKEIKVEVVESRETKEVAPETVPGPKESAAAGESAVAKRRGRLKSEEDDVEDEMSLAEMKARLGKRRDSATEPSDSEASDDDAEPEDSVVKRLRARKGQGESPGMKLRSKESPSATSTPRKPKTTPTKTGKGKKKPSFGDGSDFAPGWEEQVYLFKRSLRMPARLINIPRPRDATRLCASLPDLDPCPNSTEFPARRGLRRWPDADADSDFDSASNLSTPLDSEDATSSSLSGRLKAKDKNNLLTLIVQKYNQSNVERNKSDKKCSDSELLGSRKCVKTERESPAKSGADSAKLPAKKGRPFKKKTVKEEQVPPKDTGQLRRFRKKSATTFREAFLANGEVLALKSRTRRQAQLNQHATLRKVFGEDRPASAPPACGDGSDSDDGDAKKSTANRGRSAALARSNKAVFNSKRRLLQGGRRRNPNLIRALASKTLLELGDATMDLDAIGEDILAGKVPLLKKRMKLRNVRRKFRSGFDYIRKKKKPIKKDVDSEGIVIVREKQKRHTILRPSSESVQDIQNEIRGWVINKGLGETLLHRAARLGYTDVAAYCLEKLDNPASPRDNAGYTPLHEACSRGHMDIARLLLMYGANVSDGAVGGVRPLHEATENGFVEMMRLLLSYGADPLLATYSGQTPLAMANDEDARRLLQLHLADVQGLPAQPWYFQEYTSCERVESGYNVLQDPPCLSPESPEDDDIEMELSDIALPVLYRLRGDSPADRWVLLQDLTALLRAKSKDSLLRQLGPEPRNLVKELKMADFLEQARCCHLLGGGERINVRASKVALVPYNDKVREMLGVEKIAVSSR